MKAYYLTDEKNGLYLRPDGKQTGYIITDSMTAMPMWPCKELAIMMAINIGIYPNKGWIIKEMEVKSKGSIPLSKEGELIDKIVSKYKE